MLKKGKAEETKEGPSECFDLVQNRSKISCASRKSSLPSLLISSKALSYSEGYLEGSYQDHHLPGSPAFL